jgi:YidC/Oxa1 family membrane protein insertase
MEGQGKRLLLAVALALGVMLLWNMIFPSEPPPEPPPGTGSGSGKTPAAAIAVAKSKVCYAKPPADAKPVDMKAVESPVEIVTRTFPGRLNAKFSAENAALVSWQLADERFQKDATQGELMAKQAGSFQVGFWEKSSLCLPQRTVWTLDKAKTTETVIVFTYTHESLELTKVFTIVPDAYAIRMAVTVKVKNEGKESINQRLAVSAFQFQDPAASDEGGMQVSPRIWSSSTLRDGEIVTTTLKELQESAAHPAVPRFEPNITWTGFEHPYLQISYAPKRVSPAEIIAKHTYPIEPYGLMRTDIETPLPDEFKPGTSSVTREVIAYLGPKNYYQLIDADAIADQEGWDSGFKETVDLGWFAFIGRPLMWLLFKFQSVVVNWGIAIMLLTFLVKGLTLYWTTKSMRSMKAMAALAPQMKALQEKYKNDKQRIQAETMALYKVHNVNPIAGCLPILLQMPIWIALYRMLSSAGELYQQPFIPGWIDDLTNTDPFYILPIVLLVTMFAQARLTPQSGDSRQQKFLQYGMPLMFGVMAFFFPAGLTIYIFTNTCLSALHSIYMNKYDKKSLEIMARMKKSAEDAAKTPAEKKTAAAAAKKVVDTTATEKKDNDDDGDDDDGGNGASTASSPAKSGPPRNRPKRKKRRR